MKAFDNLYTRFPFLKFLGNRYVLVIIFVVVWLIFLDNYNYFEHRVLNKEIKELEDNKAYYQDEIAKDSVSIKQLKNADQTEKYAREKYFMKREDEDIYIIDFEENEPKIEDTTQL